MHTKPSTHDIWKPLERMHSERRVRFSRLDRLLADSDVLESKVEEILEAIEDLPVEDDRVEKRIPSDAGLLARDAGALRHFVGPGGVLDAEEEVQLAKRIEFLKRRLERIVALADVPASVKAHYFDALEVPEGERRSAKHRSTARTFDLDAIEAGWDDYLDQRNELIAANVPLADKIAMRYRTYGIPHGDLVQHGSIGLIRAVDKFDWRKNVRFRTYAEWWIRQAIERATDTDRDVIHVPRPMRQKISKANRLVRSMGTNRPLDSEQFAKLMNVDRGAAARAFSIKSGVTSLDRVNLEDGRPMKDDLVGPDLAGSAAREEMEHLRSRIAHMLDELPEREARVLHLRYGLGGGEPHTLEEVGEILDISRERVRQLQMRALDHLKEAGVDPRTTAHRAVS